MRGLDPRIHVLFRLFCDFVNGWVKPGTIPLAHFGIHLDWTIIAFHRGGSPLACLPRYSSGARGQWLTRK